MNNIGRPMTTEVVAGPAAGMGAAKPSEQGDASTITLYSLNSVNNNAALASKAQQQQEQQQLAEERRTAEESQNEKQRLVLQQQVSVGGVHFEWEDVDEKPGRVGFSRASALSQRTSANSSGFATRLSMAIRRSLRLGPKQRSTALQQLTPTTAKKVEEKQWMQPFTDNTDLKRQPCEMAFGNIAELQYMLQMNRKNQVKKFVRHNDWPVSHEIRTDLWRVLCNYKDLESNKTLYRMELDRLMNSGVKTIQPAFLSMDGIVVDDHGLKQQGSVALQRVLIVVECVRPELRYVPILYPLCAMLLHYMDAEETFASVMRFLNAGPNYLVQSDVAQFASQHTLLALLKKHRKSAYNFLKRRAGTADDQQLAAVFQPWASWIFKQLPFEYLVRVVDCFLVEGHKMLLRVALSLLYLWYKQRVRSAATAAAGPTPEARVAEIADQVSVLAQNCPVSAQTLLDMGFAIRNFKHSTFEHLQKHYEDKFRSEVQQRRTEHNVSVGKQPYTPPFKSVIVDAESAQDLMAALPSRFQLETPVLMFRLSEHGASFTQLWAQVDEAEQSLIIIRATSGAVFGAYCSASWVERKDVRERARTRYFGTGESFVFKQPKGQLFPTIYFWVGRNHEEPDKCLQMFMTAGDRFMIIGSGDGDAIAIRDELTHGLSYPCKTFGSTALVADTAFDIDEFEVFNVVSAGAF